MTGLAMLLQYREDVFVKHRWARGLQGDSGPEHSATENRSDQQALHYVV